MSACLKFRTSIQLRFYVAEAPQTAEEFVQSDTEVETATRSEEAPREEDDASGVVVDQVSQASVEEVSTCYEDERELYIRQVHEEVRNAPLFPENEMNSEGQSSNEQMPGMVFVREPTRAFPGIFKSWLSEYLHFQCFASE